jgi:hypothetical protein
VAELLALQVNYALSAPGTFLLNDALSVRTQKAALYAPELRHRLAGHDAGAWLLEEFEASRQGGGDDLDTLLAVDVRSYLPSDLLVKMDIATMACSRS